MIRVLIADDHVLMREGLKQFFEYVDDIVVGGEAANGEEVLTALRKTSFDLVLLDVSMPGLHGAELIKRIRENSANPPILMLTMHNELQIAKRKFKAGAMGYITKNSPPTDLMDAIRKVAAGGRYLAPAVAEQIVHEASHMMDQALHELLTLRELSILKLLVKGKKVSEIAEDLGISIKTVSAHKMNIKQKMKIDNDADLMRYAIAHDL